MTGPGKAELSAMVEEATIDCDDEEEQLTGLATMVEENFEVPFATTGHGREPGRMSEYQYYEFLVHQRVPLGQLPRRPGKDDGELL